ncbi:hypothetical protein [Pseudomonas sp. G5(2012)]|uniref:hypothetical protein n=1 Tax=Pseudomonas sp. G5(2012) TaxID=1268068 RepID=UPI00034322CB|nr:hypothetical protein [Pseudomonas sp. G5(2012)]EPA97879.1 hypothetical protein PG5_16080 [Pseudomonas sp. G5(2012)]
MSRKSVLLIALTGAFATPAFADEFEICRAPLLLAATESFEQFDQVDQMSYRYDRACGVEKSESSNGFDGFIETVVKVPFKAGLSAESTNSNSKQWCKENSSFARDKSFSSRVYKTVFAPALTSFNNCISAMKSKLQVELKPQTSEKFVVTMINLEHRGGVLFQGVSTTPENQANCDITYKKMVLKGRQAKSVVPFDFDPGQMITFDCTRSKVNGIYPEASFNFKNNLQNYTYVMAEFNANPKKDPVEPRKYVMRLDGETMGNEAYWDGKMQFTKRCRETPAGMAYIGKDTELPVVHKPDTVPYCLDPVKDFGGNIPCTGSNEFCKIIQVKKGCYVNSEWLTWYDNAVKSKNLVRSDEQICAPQNII